MIEEARLLYAAPEEIRAYQLDRLRQTVERAAKAPAFADRFRSTKVSSLEDLARLRVTTKKDLRDASPFGSVAVPNAQLFQYHESYGTTGKPVSSWLTRNDFNEYARQINQCALNFGPEDTLVNKFPYAISVPAHIIKHAAQQRGACVISADHLSPVCPYTRSIELMKALRATVLTCLPAVATMMGATAVAMDEMSREEARKAGKQGPPEGFHPSRDFNLRALGTAGELLTEARRRRLGELWRCKVFNYYGTTETGNMATDCEHGNLHLAWDHFLFEVVDEQKYQPVAPGEAGMPLVTTLTREAMPLVRYALTDRVRLETDHQCPCGRRSPIVRHFGRDLNCFMYPPEKGKLYSMADLEDRLFRLPAEAVGNTWMIVLTPDKVHFRVEAARPDAALYRNAEEAVKAEFGLPLVIDPVPVGGLIPTWYLMQPAVTGKPNYYCVAESLATAPRNLLELWMGPMFGGPPPGMGDGPPMGGPGGPPPGGPGGPPPGGPGGPPRSKS
jgi:phenylacetate-CoA ligase